MILMENKQGQTGKLITTHPDCYTVQLIAKGTPFHGDWYDWNKADIISITSINKPTEPAHSSLVVVYD